MKLLRSFVIVAGVALAFGATADRAAAGGFGQPAVGSNNGGGAPPQRTTLFGMRNGGQGTHSGLGLNLFQPKPKLPVFQAAPWYQYWPYDGHFMTPAPVTGAFSGPPITGNFPVNPYFPGAQNNYGPVPAYPGLPQPMPR